MVGKLDFLKRMLGAFSDICLGDLGCQAVVIVVHVGREGVLGRDIHGVILACRLATEW